MPLQTIFTRHAHPSLMARHAFVFLAISILCLVVSISPAAADSTLPTGELPSQIKAGKATSTAVLPNKEQSPSPASTLRPPFTLTPTYTQVTPAPSFTPAPTTTNTSAPLPTLTPSPYIYYQADATWQGMIFILVIACLAAVLFMGVQVMKKKI